MNNYRLRFNGTTACVMHSAQLADPQNEYVVEMKKLTKLRTKTDEIHEQIRHLEWQGGIYLNEELMPYWPGANMKKIIILAARRSKLGKVIGEAMHVELDSERFEFAGMQEFKKDLKACFHDPRFCIHRMVTVNGSKIPRTRPMFPAPWVAECVLSLDEELITKDQLLQFAEDAGYRIGLGDVRAPFGRFTAELVKV